MPWVRFDDRFPSNRKIRLLSDSAFRLYVSAICWSAENLTDGVVKTTELRLVADVRAARTRAEELVKCGLWEEVSGVGWRIHDYHEYNPTAEQARADRKAKAARQQRWREKRNSNDARPEPPDVDASHDPSRDAPQDPSEDASPRARVPSPTRPDPTPRASGAGGRAGTGGSARGTDAPSSIPADWQPSIEDVRAAQRARTDAGQPTLTGEQLAALTRKFVRRQHADQRQLTAAAWRARWQEWAERERPTDSQQPPLLFGLTGGNAPRWPHEQPAPPATPVPPSYAERMAQLDAIAEADSDTA